MIVGLSIGIYIVIWLALVRPFAWGLYRSDKPWRKTPPDGDYIFFGTMAALFWPITVTIYLFRRLILWLVLGSKRKP